jgi:Trk K+ transport system NAD-binding subunit
VPTPRIEQIVIDRPHQSELATRLWREWCFVRVVTKRFWLRFALVGLILLGGAISFMLSEPEKNHSFARALFFTWSLVFGEPPEAFPQSLWLEIMFFVMPIIGLVVIIESIIEFSLMLRDRRRFERSWCTMLASSFTDHIILVGLGRLGYSTFRLLRKLGEPVVVIERDKTNQFLDDLRRDGSPLLVGDARREAILEDANVAGARSIILATDDDLANLEAALDARRLNPTIRVVLRMFDQNLADKMGEGFDIHIAMSQSAISAPAFAISAIEPSIVNSFIVGEKLVVMQRWLVRDSGPLAGHSVGELIEEYGITVIERRPVRGDAALFPGLDTRLERGDRVIVQGSFEVLHDLQQQAMEAV